MKRVFGMLLGLAMLGACAQPAPNQAVAPATAIAPQPAPAPPPPPPPAAPAASASLDDGTRWNVEATTCAQLLGAADDDRAAAAMFYYGYLAARGGYRVLNPKRIENDIERVMTYCEAHPAVTVPHAFRGALRAGG